MSNLITREERQEEIDFMIKLRGESTHEQNSERLAKEQGFGETAAGKRFTNQAIQGFVEKFNEYVGDQIESSVRPSAIIKKLVVLGGDQPEYLIDPIQIGRFILRSLLRSLVRPDDRRITVTRVGFDIGESLEKVIEDTIGKTIGLAVENSVKGVILDTDHVNAKKKHMDMLRRQGKLGDQQVITDEMNSLAKKENIDHNDWSEKDHGSVGIALLGIFYQSKVYGQFEDEGLVFGDLFKEIHDNKFVGGKKHTMNVIDIDQKGTQWLQENYDFISSITLSFLPMVVEPEDWEMKNGNCHGGYSDEEIYKTYSLIKGYSKEKIAKLYGKYPQGFNTLMKTINLLQKTPFRVNETIWEAVNFVHKGQINIDRKGIPDYERSWDKAIGEDAANEYLFDVKKRLTRKDKVLTDEAKATLLKFAKSVIKGSSEMSDQIVWKEWSNIRREVIKHARSETSKRILMDNTLTDSMEFFGEDIYFCYNADYRGRIYPLAGQFSPQGSDISRGMLEFANGVTVDPVTDTDAIRQIAIVIANNFGEDKISLDDREMWTSFNTDAILECADDFKNNRWWMEADKPFLFLQGCLEWKKYIDAKDAGETFVSTMPISFDGSCNGIQHYSALFADEVGAKAVNLVNSDIPSDVYQEVANKALALAEKSNNKHDKIVVELNEKLDGKLFGRKVAKRSVMTLPYGVSKRSSNAYVVDEVNTLLRTIEVEGKDLQIVRNRMGSLIWNAILEVVKKPVTGKVYFQDVAKEMAGWDKGLLWFTPTGLPVTQSLKKRNVKPDFLRVTLTLRDNEGEKITTSVMRKYPKYTSELDGGEQANAIAPNFVHSYDSAHLQFSVIASGDEGMTNFLVIHDSFATDCLNAGRFNMIIREQFVKMYSNVDYINKFHQDCEMQLSEFDEDGAPLNTIELVTPQESRGNFDINQVLESEYFFS